MERNVCCSMAYLVAYDISDPKRLRRVAKAMVRHALRCQKSVFFHRGDAAAVVAVLNEVAPLMDPESDTVQAWKLAKQVGPRGLLRGRFIPGRAASVILGGGEAEWVEDLSATDRPFAPRQAPTPDRRRRPPHANQRDLPVSGPGDNPTAADDELS